MLLKLAHEGDGFRPICNRMLEESIKASFFADRVEQSIFAHA
jgi:hypothetical protein